MRKEVLKGCVITFSRVWPGMFLGHTVPIWRLAERYGAKCKDLLDWEVTHVVAHRLHGPDSEKSRLARVDKNRHLVAPEWITESCEGWRRQAESRYIVESTGVDAYGSPHDMFFGEILVDYKNLERDQRKTSRSGQGSEKENDKSSDRGAHQEEGHEEANGTLQQTEVGKEEDFEDDDDSFAAALETEMLAETNGTEETNPRNSSKGVRESKRDLELVNEGIKRRRKS